MPSKNNSSQPTLSSTPALRLPRIALTAGEPAGIGPDLAIMLAQTWRSAEVIVIADATVLRARATELDLPLEVRPFDPEVTDTDDPPGTLCVLDVPLVHPVTPGSIDPANARSVLDTLDLAMDGCLDGRFSAVVTAPVHKGVINDAGISFSGHTEYLADRCGAKPVMMLTAGNLRVALVTTHLPLAEVAQAIKPARLERVLRTLHDDLVNTFGIDTPRILVAGLNPHAGESGHLGREEIDIIEPTLTRLCNEGLQLVGPLPADTLFTPQHLSRADAVLAMYHDQGLPVLKYAGFGQGVNVTLGLPLIRTSVDHGTALDKAGKGNIDAGSLFAALDLATTLANKGQHSTASVSTTSQ